LVTLTLPGGVDESSPQEEKGYLEIIFAAKVLAGPLVLESARLRLEMSGTEFNLNPA
jgi:hypothetical protein